MQLRNRQIEGQDSSPLHSPLALLESPPVTTADRIAAPVTEDDRGDQFAVNERDDRFAQQ